MHLSMQEINLCYKLFQILFPLEILYAKAAKSKYYELVNTRHNPYVRLKLIEYSRLPVFKTYKNNYI